MAVIKFRILLNNNKKGAVVILLSSLLILSVLSGFTEKKLPIDQTKSFCLENIKLMQAQLDTFQMLSENKADRNILLSRFKKVRLDFKKFEFFLEYFDPNRYPFFNGANAIEMDEGYFDPTAKPEGLQVIESEFYNDTLDLSRIVYLTKQLKYRTLSFYLYLRDAPLRDAFAFESIRFHLIRLETLSLVAFDSPDLRNNTEEIISTFHSLQKIFSFYKNDKNEVLFSSLNSKLEKAITYLSTKNFKNLDRLFFIKKYIQPIANDVSEYQNQLGILSLEQTNKVFRAVNLNAKTIYDTDFLNSKFYAQDKYYKDNPLYSALGKKLFYDNRMSSDGTMSCATCHQPANFFTDKLPTAITNKTGEFQKRNTPSLLNVALQASYFYDLASMTLESQIDNVMSNQLEFNHSFDSFLVKIKADTQYVRLFSAAFPTYKEYAISNATIIICIADFERKMIQLNSPFDKYMRGETNKIDASVKRGFNLFMGKAQCGACHFAPTYFGTLPPFYGVSEAEVLGVTKRFDTIHPMLDDDIGKFKNMEIDAFKFAMKTSTVRNAELTAPYMHNGGFKTLDEVIEFYNHGGGAGLGLDIPNQTLSSDRLNLTKQDKNDIISFIKSLTDTSGLKRFALDN